MDEEINLDGKENIVEEESVKIRLIRLLTLLVGGGLICVFLYTINFFLVCLAGMMLSVLSVIYLAELTC